MAQAQEYDCIVCGAHFESSKELDRHNREQHVKHATGMEKPRGSAGESENADRWSAPPED